MRILIAECMQEISSFNPLPSRLRGFPHRARRRAASRQRGLKPHRRRAVRVRQRAAMSKLVPTIRRAPAAPGCSRPQGWQRLSAEILDGGRAPRRRGRCALHLPAWRDGRGRRARSRGLPARAKSGEAVRPRHPDRHLARPAWHPDRPDAAADRRACRSTRPIRMSISPIPGARAARLLLDIVDRGLQPVIARVVVPMLARGDECITKTGCYGTFSRDGQLLERLAPRWRRA